MKKIFTEQYKKLIAVFLFLSFLGSFFAVSFPSVASANPASVSVSDWVSINTEMEGNVQDTAWWSWEKMWEELKDNLSKAGSKAYYSALSKALRTIAYDTATWIGSGGEGQKPLFIREGWGEYLKNVADNAAGHFIEDLMDESGFENVNLCRPSAGVRGRIALGLTQYAKPSAPDCTFMEMTENWSQALQSENFLNDIQNMFDPVSNDVGITFNSYVQMIGEVQYQKEIYERDREEGGGWLDLRNHAGLRDSFPGAAEMEAKTAYEMNAQNLGTYTGSALIDAMNVFLNQLAITLFQKLMRGIGKDGDKYTSSYDNWGNYDDYDSAAYQDGADGAKKRFNEIIQPDFSIRGDYDILADLTICPDPTNAGPTNCVVDDKFRQAIQERMTVAQAIDAGYLNPNGTFGFLSNGLEPSYIDAYPYRSMPILRKFRIIPVGWELAAQYLKDNISGTTLSSKNLGDLVACFDDNSPGNEWCNGLVDPDWVLKAPLNYCAKEGYGNYILNSSVVGEDKDSKLLISRGNDYCADEQSCIKEYDDGSCEAYGYCTEEKRKWNFDSDSCDPKYNTCQSFSKVGGGQTQSFLKNTLEYCDAPGCMAYCEDYDYSSGNYDCSDPLASSILYLKDAADCSANEEGCNEFIRFYSGGVNLLQNSSFEVISPAIFGATQDCTGGATESVAGECIGELAAGNSSYVISLSNIIKASGYEFGGERFAFSLFAKNCGDAEIRLGGNCSSPSSDFNYSSSTMDSTVDWKRFGVNYLASTTDDELEICVRDASAGCQVDALMVEKGASVSAYSDYRESGLVYQKMLPDYLEDACYEDPLNDFSYKDNAPDECFDYTGKCSADDVGCELYTSTRNGFTYPARVDAFDYCPQECSGYSEYLRTSSVFDSQSVSFMITDSAKTCNKSSVGCTEFTNLDKIGDGAENIEYYSELKHCVGSSDSDPNPDCENYYTWEGTDESGFQLKVHTLKKDPASSNPAVVEDDSNECSLDIFNLPPTDPGYNFDCREFYDTDGNVSYHLYSRVITCSDNCHPYRRSDFNIIKDYQGMDIDPGDCNASNKEYFGPGTVAAQIHYNADGQCIYCKSGGVWNNEHGACIYQAIPDEGKKCNAGQSGCREYSGTTGNDLEVLVNDDFESAFPQDWNALDGSSISSDTSYVSGGNALRNTGGENKIKKEIGGTVETGKSYYLSFVAKPYPSSTAADSAKNIISIAMDNGFDVQELMGNQGGTLSADWKFYEFSITKLDHVASINEELIIQMDGDFLIDNIRLVKTRERYYLIKDSWYTPDSCYTDILGAPVDERYNLRCDEYTDRADNYHYLRKFSEICGDSVIGCELVIDTHNYSDYDAGNWSNPPYDPEVTVSADSAAYIVYNASKNCQASRKGCQRLGEIFEHNSGTTLYDDVYKINDPDTYDEKLCSQGEENCAEWMSDEGSVSFLDPRENYCTWSIDFSKWIQKSMKRCDNVIVDGVIDFASETNVCFDSADCAVEPSNADVVCSEDSDCDVGAVSGYKCVESKCRYSCIDVEDVNEYDCPIDYNIKTIGTGGYKVDQPGYFWAGSCPASESGCTEYIDPISAFNANLVLNPTRESVGASVPYWSGNSQSVTLKSNTLYSFFSSTAAGATLNNFSPSADVFLFDLNNNLFFTSPSSDLSSNDSTVLFYASSSEDVLLANVNSISTGLASEILLKESAVAYRYSQDIQNCPEVNFDEGCVLFNERSIVYNIASPLSYKELIYDADDALNPMPSCVPGSLDCDSNNIIQVKPDRECNEWLSCKSFAKDESGKNICFDVGLCNRFSELNTCQHFISASSTNQIYFDGSSEFSDYHDYTPPYHTTLNSSDIVNMSGYSKVANIASDFVSDFYPLAAMDQVGGIVAGDFNGSFEHYGNNYYPLGWSVVQDGAEEKKWIKERFTVIDNPVDAQKEGVSYPVEGKAFLKYSPALGKIYSDFIDVEPNTEYILSMKINTLNFVAGSGFEVTKAGIWVQTYSSSDQPTGPGGNGNDFEWTPDHTGGNTSPDVNGILAASSGGMDWHENAIRFKIADGNTKKIKLMISAHMWFGGVHYNGDVACYPNGSCNDEPGEEISTNCWGTIYTTTMTSDACTGNVYIDDIKLMPVLEAKDQPRTQYSINTNDYKDPRHISQSCRLYPESDSLACEYAEDSGIRKKGWYGYCLEFDRSPGSEDTCLLWYPIDNVEGQGIEEGAGYLDRYPVYYATEGVPEKVLEYRHAFYRATECGSCPNPCPSDDQYKQLGVDTGEECDSRWYHNLGIGSPSDVWNCYCIPRGTPIVADGTSDPYTDNLSASIHNQDRFKINSSSDGWYKYDGRPLYNFPSLGSWGGPPRIRDTNYYFDQLCKDQVIKIEGNEENNNNTTEYCELSQELYRTRIHATKIVEVVTETGENKYWKGRIFNESNHEIYRDSSRPITYDSDYYPFGSVVPPGGEDFNIISNPFEWDSNEKEPDKQPLYFELPDEDISDPHQARMGEVFRCVPNSPTAGGEPDDCKYVVSRHETLDYPYDYIDFSERMDETTSPGYGRLSPDVIRHLFAQSYGNWDWVGDGDGGYYQLINSGGWEPPKDVCSGPGGTRPIYDERDGAGQLSTAALSASYCGINPVIDNVKINDSDIVAELNKNGFVNLTFTSKIDPMQLPLVMYSVNWGDGDALTVGGIEMRDRSSVLNPHSLYHYYDYWQLLGKSDLSTIDCGSDGAGKYCDVDIKIRIKDNWGWETSYNSNSRVKVYEK